MVQVRFMLAVLFASLLPTVPLVAQSTSAPEYLYLWTASADSTQWWRAFAPLTESFILSKTGEFVGE
jgi:hypothetical protein